MVDDPSDCPEEFRTEEEQNGERERLHSIIRRLINDSSNDDLLLAEARYEIARSVARSKNEAPPPKDKPAQVLRYLNDKALPVYDPFAGGGSIPLEAQRLGLRAVASDLNPVAVLINKALIEIPPKFSGKPPVNPDANPMGMFTAKFKGRGKNRKQEQVPWRGASGLANDIRYYGKWMRGEAFKRVGHLYPEVKLPNDDEVPVLAWLWARTVPCPNPACGVIMPLVRTFQISRKRNNEHWTKPIVDAGNGSISFKIQNTGEGVPDGSVTNNRVTCVSCQSVSPLTYVRDQASTGNMSQQMIAIITKHNGKTLFLPPSTEHITIATQAEPDWRPAGKLPDRALGFRVQGYGFSEWHQLFTERQLCLLTVLCDLLQEMHSLSVADGSSSEYADALCTYMSLAISRTIHNSASFTRWRNDQEAIVEVFPRGALPMIWDFAESNPFSLTGPKWDAQTNRVSEVISRLPANVNQSEVYQADASTTSHATTGPVIVTDPPYYANVGYADLSDFFYVWLRLLLRNTYFDLFAGMATPKENEMVAASRFKDPNEHFKSLMSKTLKRIREYCSVEFPSSIFYAYKQQEERHGGEVSTGWETMLNAVVSSGFQIVGTWPIRTERRGRLREIGSNALASSIILVCRPRAENAPIATRREFLNELERELPAALDNLTREGHIAPVDLAQAAIGPGMQVYSRYSRVEMVSGETVAVRDALIEINRVIAEYHRREQGELDSASQFCVDWLQEYGYSQGEYGRAEVLAQAKNVAVDFPPLSGMLSSGGGTVRLIRMDDFAPDRPLSGGMTAWEGCMRMAYHFKSEYGRTVEGAADVARDLSGLEGGIDAVERLARILYDYFDRRNDSSNAVAFNTLATSWQDILTRMQGPRSDRLL